jgi:hypothetical protein
MEVLPADAQLYLAQNSLSKFIVRHTNKQFEEAIQKASEPISLSRHERNRFDVEEFMENLGLDDGEYSESSNEDDTW